MAKITFRYDYTATLNRFWRNEKDKLTEAKIALEDHLIPFFKKKKFVYTDLNKVDTYSEKKVLECKNFRTYLYKRGIAECVVLHRSNHITLIVLLPSNNKWHHYSKISSKQKSTMCMIQASVKYTDDPCIDALHKTINNALDHILEGYDPKDGYLREMVWNDKVVKRVVAKLDEEEITPEIDVVYNETNDQEHIKSTYIMTMFDLGVIITHYLYGEKD